MSKNQNVTPADLAAKAAEEKLVIPTQPDEKVPAEEQNTDAKVVNEDGEVTTDPRFKARLASLTNLVKENKRVIAGLAATMIVAGAAFAKYAKKKVEKEILEQVSVDDEPELTLGDLADESAA